VPIAAHLKNATYVSALAALGVLAVWDLRREEGRTRRFGPRRAQDRSEHNVVGASLGRGRAADNPTEIPPAGWKDILWRTFQEVKADDIQSVARSIAFAGMLALFPALAAFVSIYGLFADVETARDHLAGLTGFIPAGAATFIGEQMVRIAASKDAGLGLTFVTGLLLSLWSANAGMKALFKGLNIAYEEEEKRGFLKLNLITLAFTFGMVVFFAVSLAAVVAIPLALQTMRLDAILAPAAWLRWPLLLVATVLGLALLYRFGPSREKAKWRWISFGSAAATVLWLAGSALFSWYLGAFADYNATYGSLGAVFGFMVWLWLSCTIVLFGAELNSEIEHQTARDSTTGASRPLGARGAQMADSVGEAKTGSLLPPALDKLRPSAHGRLH
jgi:membrane protein